MKHLKRILIGLTVIAIPVWLGVYYFQETLIVLAIIFVLAVCYLIVSFIIDRFKTKEV